MTSNVEKKILNAIVKTFNIKKESINSNCSMKNLKSWDSLNHVKLLVVLQKELNKPIESSKFLNLNSYKKLVNYFTKK